MKKFLIIFSLGIFAMSQIGYYCAFLYRQHTLENETKKHLLHNLPEEVLSTFKLKDVENKIDWKGEDEFSLQGKMYDLVKQSRNSKGETILYAVADIKEDALITKYLKTTEGKSNKKQAAGIPTIFLLYPPAEPSPTKIYSANISRYYYNPSSPLQQGYMFHLYAPPRIA